MPSILSDPTSAGFTLIVDPDDSPLTLQDPSMGRRLVEFDAPAPDLDSQWASSADTEGERRAGWRYTNRTITAKVLVTQSSDALLEAAENTIGQKIGKLQRDGGELELGYPSGNTITFDVEEANLRRTYTPAHVAMRLAEYTFTFVCRVGGRSPQVTGPTATGTDPLLVLDITDVPGDLPAETLIVVTDSESQSRRYLEWGAGPDVTNDLIIDSDDMTTTGFAGTGSTQSGAYDPGAAGNSVISMSLFGPQAMAGFTGAHTGKYKARGRFYCNTSDPAATKIWLVWHDQDNPDTSNPVVKPIIGVGWNDLDLGEITVTGDWSGYIVAESPYYTETLKLDYVKLIPADAGYGKARAVYSYQPGVTVGRDEFTSSTAAAVLHTATSGRSAPTGGDWVTSGAATDFAYADDLSGEQIKRSTTSDGGKRWAVLGSTDYTDTEVRVDVQRSTTPTTSALRYGPIARWTDASNYLRAEVYRDNGNLQYLYLIQRVVASETTLAGPIEVHPSAIVNGAYFQTRLIVFSSGRVIFRVFDAAGTNLIAETEATSSALATGGALASGKPGFFDLNQSSNAIDRYFDNFQVATPAAEPIVVYADEDFRIDSHSRVERANSDGTKYGRPPSWEGHRILLPPGDTRVAVRANRVDLDASLCDTIDDSLDVASFYTPRWLNVPGA